VAATSAQAWQMKQALLMTSWASQVDTHNPLPEYPRPQMVRSNWLSLNGIWQFQAGAAGDAVPTNQTLAGEILVPFPMEWAISGVMQYHDRSWYLRTLPSPLPGVGTAAAAATRRNRCVGNGGGGHARRFNSPGPVLTGECGKTCSLRRDPQ
jgi:hypothetical protein